MKAPVIRAPEAGKHARQFLIIFTSFTWHTRKRPSLSGALIVAIPALHNLSSFAPTDWLADKFTDAAVKT